MDSVSNDYTSLYGKNQRQMKRKWHIAHSVYPAVLLWEIINNNNANHTSIG
jgi:hypothetical protein